MDKVSRYYGLYRGIVKDNKDPENLRRIKVLVPQITGDFVSNWVWPILSTKRPPAINQGVWVSYIGGDLEYPIWIGEYGKDLQGILSHGSFFSTQTQTTSVNTATTITYNNTDLSEGVYLSGSQIKVDYDGTYNFMFSIQFYHLSGGGGGSAQNAYVWFNKNGAAIPNSATYATIPKGNYNSMTVNLFVPMTINDTVELAWTSNSVDMQLKALAASSPHPAVPSVILTVNQVA